MGEPAAAAPAPADELWDGLMAAGFDFFTGVADSTLQGLFTRLEGAGDAYVPAVAEDLAVGLAVGAYLGGRRPAVLMQNSGLGLCFNALSSLAVLYRVPLLLVVGWRGWDGRDAPEHELSGRTTLPLLAALDLPCRVAERESLAADLAAAVGAMEERRLPSALVVRPGILDR